MYFNIIITCTPSILFPSDFPAKTLCAYFSPHACHILRPSHSWFFITLIIFCVQYWSCSSSPRSFPRLPVTSSLLRPNLPLSVILSNSDFAVTRCLPIMYRYGWDLRFWQRSASRSRSFKTSLPFRGTKLHRATSLNSVGVFTHNAGSRVFRLHATHKCRRSCRSSTASCHLICCRTA